jgi:hypothetical protein
LVDPAEAFGRRFNVSRWTVSGRLRRQRVDRIGCGRERPIAVASSSLRAGGLRAELLLGLRRRHRLGLAVRAHRDEPEVLENLGAAFIGVFISNFFYLLLNLISCLMMKI